MRAIRVAAKAARTDTDGSVFASKTELRRWKELQLLERAGEITNLRRQVAFPLAIEGRPLLLRSARYPNGRKCKYTVDFLYVRKLPDGGLEWVYEDTKGYATELSRLRIAVFEAQYGVRVTITEAK